MMLKCFIDLGILSPQQCGTATTHFKAFLDEKLKMFCADFDGFSRDCFQLVMVISHGQAAIDQGFSHNSFLLKANMIPKTAIAKCLIKDHMLLNDLKPHNIDISKLMIKALKSPQGKYQMHLEDQLQNQVSMEGETKECFFLMRSKHSKVKLNKCRKELL